MMEYANHISVLFFILRFFICNAYRLSVSHLDSYTVQYQIFVGNLFMFLSTFISNFDIKGQIIDTYSFSDTY
jgi:hypothetical protein